MSSRLRDSFLAVLKPAIGFALLLALWQFGAPLAQIPDYVLPLPSSIAARFAETFTVQMTGLAWTAFTTLAGLALALICGVLLALLVIYIPLLRAIIMPLLAAFNSIPKIAIAPLFVIWFGLGYESKILLAFLLALFPVFVNSVTGLGEIEADLIDLSTLAGGTPWRIFLKVRLMNAVPHITDAMKVAFPLALVGSIVGEFIGGNDGIGHLILSGQFNIDTPLVFAALLSITVFTTLGIGAIALFESAALKWRPSQRKR
jgi:NitT/TauT family transport system permease protein